MAHIEIGEGRTVGPEVRRAIEAHYEGRSLPPLLPAPEKQR